MQPVPPSRFRSSRPKSTRRSRDTARRFADDAGQARGARPRRDGELSRRTSMRRWRNSACSASPCRRNIGGAGLDALSYALVMEELSRGYASVADQCGLVELIGTLLSVHGTQAQREAHLADVLAARKRVSYCITEAEAGTDVSGHQDHGHERWRRLPAVGVQDLDPQCARRRHRLRPGAHGPRGGPPRHVDLHRRPSCQGRLARQEGAQDGAARLARGCAPLRRCGASAPMRCSAR